MDESEERRQATAPLNPIPLVIWVLVLPMVALELYLSLAEATGRLGLRQDLWLRMAFFPEAQRVWWAEGYVAPREWLRLVSFSFIHGGFSHILFVAVILLALGKFVGEVFRWWAVLLVFVVSAAAGAVLSALLPFVTQAVFGGYPGVYGLIGAFTYVLWVGARVTGAHPARAFSLIAFLLGAQLVFGLAFGGGTGWVAEIGGFVTGFALSVVVNPAGWAKLMAQLRRRG